jgi:tetratricopeptide (TPR) repeat protein
MASKKRRPVRQPGIAASNRFLFELSVVEPLLRSRRWDEARDALEALNRRYPGRPEILSDLVNVAYELQDIKLYQAACEQLVRVTPNDSDTTLGLAGAYLLNTRPALALQTFRRFLGRWPEHERADDARKAARDLEAGMPELLTQLGLTGEEGLDLAARNEEVQSRLEQGQFREAARLAAELLKQHPRFAPVLNNLSQAEFAEGRIEQAAATARRVLDFDPDNVHALSNLARFACLRGQPEEARKFAERLKASEDPAYEKQLKIAEAFAYLGDDESVLEAFRHAEADRAQDTSLDSAFLHHLAGVAALRLGREEEARKHWRQALALNPGFVWARENLDDLRQPVGERHAPWPFPMPQWVRQDLIQDLQKQFTPAALRRSEEAIVKAARVYLDRHPDIAALLPALLDRGDPEGRQFALRLAAFVGTPETLAALRDFALGRRGPDEMRLEAAQTVMQAGLLSPGPVTMWMQGEQQELILMGYELHGEPIHAHSPTVEALTEEAMGLLRMGRGEQAERLLKQAQELEPNAPDILNNLAAAYSHQNRSEESRALIQEIHARFPDYLFGRTNLAVLYAHEGRPSEARALLEPLLSRRRLHFSEFAAIAGAQIETAMAEGKKAEAEGWLAMWEQAEPDHPALAHARQLVKRPGALKSLFGRRRRGTS